MQAIEGVLFEPVGCLAEFPPGPFLEIASRLFGREKKPSPSGSRSYWHLVNLIQSAGEPLEPSQRQLAETLEVQAVDAATPYEDVLPALATLQSMNIKLLVASSLSGAAVARFLDRYSLNRFFSGVSSRDSAGGIKMAPLQSATAGASLEPGRVIFLADTLEGVKLAQAVGVHAILMMNDPDEGRRLAMHNPSGGIVSLHELPDFIRLVAAENASLAAAPKPSSPGSSRI